VYRRPSSPLRPQAGNAAFFGREHFFSFSTGDWFGLSGRSALRAVEAFDSGEEFDKARTPEGFRRPMENGASRAKPFTERDWLIY
jgi:hypothetical protein